MFEAYTVAVRIKLIDGVSTGLIGLSKHFGRANMEAAALQKRIDGIKSTLLTGAILTGAGVGILAMFKPALDQAKQFQNEVTKFTLYGMGDKANAEAVSFAKSMKIMGSSYVDNMRLMNEAQGIFRESGKKTLAEQLQGAKIAAPILAKLAFIESGLSDDARGHAHSQDLAMLRFIEARGGANDPRAFASIADWGYKLQKSSGGVVDWSQLQQLTATSGAAGYNLSEDAISALEPVIADMKGGRTGSGLRVAFQRLLGTQRGLPKQAVQEYLSLGLWDPSKVQLNGGGGIKSFSGLPGDVLRDRTKFATDPVAFYTQDFLPAIAKKYGNQILGDSAQAKVERAAEISMVFGPGTASAVFSQIDKLLPAIQRSLEAQNKQFGIDPSYTAAGGTAAGKELALHKQFQSLLEQTGEVVLPLLIQGLNTLLPILTSFSSWAQAHPKLFGALIDSILALGTALVVSGVVTGLMGLWKAVSLFGTVFGAGGVLARAAPIMGDIGAGARFLALGLNGLAAVRFFTIAGGIVALTGVLLKLEKIGDPKNNPIVVPGSPILQFPTPSHPVGNPHAMDGAISPWMYPRNRPGANGAVSPFIKPSSYQKGGSGPGTVYLDGRPVGKIVADHMAGAGNGPLASSSGFDGRQSFTPVGITA